MNETKVLVESNIWTALLSTTIKNLQITSQITE